MQLCKGRSGGSGKGEYDGIILTTCCDSIRRLYDVLKEEMPDKFIYMLDTPRIIKDAGITLYTQRIRDMIRAYESYSGKRFEEEQLAEIIKKHERERMIAISGSQVNVGIIGARADETIKQILRDRGANVAFDLTCTGLARKLLYEKEHVMEGYVRGF